ncbi:hypothetical protein T484DRAFT_2019922 [Baffinella frigidus]|nr:hypothetical protein T484DRAFT_2019922 [Cryptophyta sp. CCMP2293]
MDPSPQPSMPSQLARETSLVSAIAEMWETSSKTFDDPFSADMEGFDKEFGGVDDFEMQALPASFAGLADTIQRTRSAAESGPLFSSFSGHATRISSDASLASKTRTGLSRNEFTAPVTHDASNSCSKSDTEEVFEATSEGNSSPLSPLALAPTRAGTAPRSRWTTQERSLFLATVAKLGNTLDTSLLSSAHDTRSLAATVSSAVGRSTREVQSHARGALRKLRARAESKKGEGESIKTLVCIVGSSDHTS